jgi:DNA-binding transcriptional LysR family regulator
VLTDQVQIGLVRVLQHPEIEAHPCYEDELVLVVQPAHPFGVRGSVTLEEVAREGLVLFDRTSSYYDLTRGLFLDSGVVPATVMELDNIEAAKKMVEQGMGLALLPRVAVQRELALGTLVAVSIDDAPIIHRPVLAIHRKGAGLGGPGLAFLDLLSALREQAELPASPPLAPQRPGLAAVGSGAAPARPAAVERQRRQPTQQQRRDQDGVERQGRRDGHRSAEADRQQRSGHG